MILLRVASLLLRWRTVALLRVRLRRIRLVLLVLLLVRGLLVRWLLILLLVRLLLLLLVAGWWRPADEVVDFVAEFADSVPQRHGEMLGKSEDEMTG